MSPNDIEILIHYHINPEPHPRLHATAVTEAVEDFVEEDILIPVPTKDGYYTTTERGKAWLQMILATPYPERRWVDPRSEAK